MGASDGESRTSEVLCPSARCREGAVLLGIVGSNGILGYVTPQATIDAEFVGRVGAGRSPGKRFRFAEPCVTERCVHWAGNECRVIEDVIAQFGHSEHPEEATLGRVLPRCSIRPRCRWFRQRGGEACSVCPLVIRDCDSS